MKKQEKKPTPWTVNTVFVDGGIVHHTQGAVKYCGKEIELVLPTSVDSAHAILNSIVEYCFANKVKLESGKITREIFGKPMMFVATEPLYTNEEVDDVYRVVLTDKKGHFPDHPKCDTLFQRQLTQRIGLRLH